MTDRVQPTPIAELPDPGVQADGAAALEVKRSAWAAATNASVPQFNKAAADTFKNATHAHEQAELASTARSQAQQANEQAQQARQQAQQAAQTATDAAASVQNPVPMAYKASITQVQQGAADRWIDAAVLKQALAGKAEAGHTHTMANVAGLQAALDGKAPSDHGHGIYQVTGLQAALNGKANASHSHGVGDVNGLQGALNSKAPLNGAMLTNPQEVQHDLGTSAALALVERSNVAMRPGGNITIYADPTSTNLAGRSCIAFITPTANVTFVPHGSVKWPRGRIPQLKAGKTYVVAFNNARIGGQFFWLAAVSDEY
ncbi:MAG: hypothetical protein Q4A97_08485 [Comamonadaceae bacterium]|nr:hypothetical protein [Comamonadaceae bacterium]